MKKLALAGTIGLFTLTTGCDGVRPLSAFDEIVGCYKAEDGEPQIEIRENGTVIDRYRRQIAVAVFDRQSSAVEFRPGLRLDVRERIIKSQTSVSSLHMISTSAGEVVLSVHAEQADQPGMLLVKSNGRCI